MIILLRMHCLKHQQCFSQISPTFPCDSLVQALDFLPSFLITDFAQNSTNLSLRWCCNSNKQRPTPNGRNDIARRVCQQYQPQVWTVLLHCSPKRRLCIPCQVICLIDDNDLEALFRTQIDLLRLRNFLEQVLHDHSVVVSDIGRCDFEVVNGCDNIEFEFTVRGGLEDASINLDFLDSWAVEFFEGCDYTCLLACTRRAIDKEMGEITALCLDEMFC